MTLLPHKIKLNWTHITSLEDMDAKKQFLSSCGGVYLWISPLKVKRVLYIGTAKNFQKRFFDHLSSQIKGGYTEFFYDGYDDLLKYFADEIYADGRDVNFFKAKENLNEKFTFPVGCFNQEFSFRRIIPAQEKMQNRLNFINALEFAVAPIDFSLAGLSAEQLSEQVEAILQKKISQKITNFDCFDVFDGFLAILNIFDYLFISSAGEFLREGRFQLLMEDRYLSD